MLNSEELLFDELYEKTKDCGRTQFIKLLMQKDRKIQELNKKYVNAVADYETAIAEKSELKKQVETYEIEGYEQNEELNKMSFDIRKYKIQKKEFIKYLQEELNVQIQEESIGCETTNKRYILEEILQKYKEIIGDDK